MGWIQIFILIGMIVLLLKASHDKKKQEHQKLVEELKERDYMLNRNLLKKIGKQAFIEYKGQDAFDEILKNEPDLFKVKAGK